jgi:rRNA maturation RNase YbeY
VKRTLIYFFSEDIDFILPGKIKVRRWITNAISLENKELGSINYIFCSDHYLHNLNLKFLNHDTLTDIITFDNSGKRNEISGDIFISINRVRENSGKFQNKFTQELFRVMIHGILHLIGYSDKTKTESSIMRQKEDYYLSLLPNFIS